LYVGERAVGCGFFFGKIALDEMSVGHMVLYRFCSRWLGCCR